MRTDWLNKEAAEVGAPDKSVPAAEPVQRPLDDILKEREIRPPTPPNPTGNPTPVEPMSLKELAQLFETASKALLDAKLTVEKAHTALSKVQPMSSASGADKAISGKAQGYAASVQKIGASIEALATEISGYREELSKPSNPWLE